MSKNVFCQILKNSAHQVVMDISVISIDRAHNSKTIGTVWEQDVIREGYNVKGSISALNA